jgi:hypothetical protein
MSLLLSPKISKFLTWQKKVFKNIKSYTPPPSLPFAQFFSPLVFLDMFSVHVIHVLGML